MADTHQPRRDEPDPAHVHRRGEHDGLGHHHAADQHGAGRRDLAAVLDRHGARLDGDRLRLRPGRPLQPAPRRHVRLCRGRLRQSRATSWCSCSTSCRWRSATWRSAISAVGYLAGVLPLAVVDPDRDLHRPDRAALADDGGELRRSEPDRQDRLDHGLGRDHPGRPALDHRLVLVQRRDLRGRLEPEGTELAAKAWARASR